MHVVGLLSVISVGALALAGVILGYALLSETAARRPTRGLQGLKRAAALKRSTLFRAFEPLLRYGASWASKVSVGDMRLKIAKQLQRSGDYLGLTPDEYLAMIFWGSLGFTISGIVICHLGNLKLMYALGGALVGLWTPHSLVTHQIRIRSTQVNRGLPAAIDLAALCMSAGMDFIGAIRQIVTHGAGSDDAVQEELERILQELELGHTRREALDAFAERVPTESVKDFVSAVKQAEDKGNPLSEVLQVQATMLRMRRTVLAEEAAARAGVLMMIPLMMLFSSIILILLGPLVISNLQAGL
ncbi:MAG: type II secretion system F family protein [Myxococcales bacterium]|nr:type II secretion system F family protein [Myxococcales bacterium]MCB9707400.1 type II secretion system F family protein [Myxococcales bacterium]